MTSKDPNKHELKGLLPSTETHNPLTVDELNVAAIKGAARARLINSDFWDSLQDRSTEDFTIRISEIRVGLSIDFFNSLALSLCLKPKELAALIGMKKLVLSRWKKAGRLSIFEGDKIYRMALVIKAALGLFGNDITSTLTWLKRPALALGNQAPLDLFDTFVGLGAVEAFIWNIENGVYN